MMVVSIRLLGEPQLHRDGVRAPAPRGRKTWALLAYLLSCEVPPSRERLAALLFPEAADPLGALRWSLADARRLLGEGSELLGDPPQVVLSPSAVVDLTVVRRGRWSEASRLDTLGRPLLEGQRFPSAPAFQLWLDGERRHLQAQAITLLHEAGLASLAFGHADEALSYARRLVDLEPLDENNHVLLVRCLTATGQGEAAARAAHDAATLLRGELGVEPTSALRTAAHSLDGPRTFVATRAAVEARLEAADAAIAAGSWSSGLELHRQAVATARQVDDAHLLARASVALGSALVHAVRGLDEEGAAALHEGALLARQVGDRTLAATASREVAYIEFLRAHHTVARQWLRAASELSDGDPAELAWVRLIEGACDTDLGEYASGGARLREAVDLADAHGLARAGAFALSFLGRWHLLRDELEPADETLSRSIQLARTAGWTSLIPWPEALLGEVQLLRGDLDAAEVSFQHAYTMGQQLGDVCWESMALRGLGVVAARAGDLDEAIVLLEQAPRRCVALPDSYLWIASYGLDALSDVAATHGLASTNRWVQEAERTAAQFGLKELHVRALLHRARAGDEAALVAALTLGTTIDNPALQREFARLAH